MSSQRELQNVKIEGVQDSQDMFEVYKEEMMNPASEHSPKTPIPYEMAAFQAVFGAEAFSFCLAPLSYPQPPRLKQ